MMLKKIVYYIEKGSVTACEVLGCSSGAINLEIYKST
jgi:hypothetical protein